MLKNLYIRSFILIDEINVDFFHGMNVITGETGSGKSILIDAIGQLCGDRSNSSFVKKDADKAIIEAIFDNPEIELLNSICKDNHIELDDDFWIQKTILNNGKSVIKINNTTVANRVLKMIVPLLIDIHSQFDTGRSFQKSNHIHLLDQYATLNNLISNYESEYEHLKDLENTLTMSLEEELSDEQLEYIESQIKEINDYYYTDEEVDTFSEELKALENYEKLNSSFQEYNHLMSAEQGAITMLKDACDALSDMSSLESFKSLSEKMYDYFYEINDLNDSVYKEFKALSFDENRYNELSEIMFNINKLKRKYGMNMERILETKHHLENKLELIKNRDAFIENLNKEISIQKDKCTHLANEISEIRKENASKFEKEISEHLRNLYLENANFKIDILDTDLNKNGNNEVTFLVSMNKGQEYSVLNESASGGEIARLMLIIKTILAQHSSADTIIFDEIDTGVSGKIASSIGKYMSGLSKTIQLLCITHLPQVAVNADYHYLIKKDNTTDSTYSTIKLLDENNRLLEIAKMLSNENITDEAIENAKRLLQTN